MDRRITAAMTALLIILMTICFPISAAYAESEETTTQENSEVTIADDDDPTYEALDELTIEPPATDKEVLLDELESIKDGYVYSFEDLQTQLGESNEVTLGANVTIPQGERLGLHDVTIHTGDYGIIAEGVLELGSLTMITGEGSLQPVVEISDGGSLFIGYSDYKDAPCITATGNGGSALLLRKESRYSQSYSAFMRIVANGAGGIALESEIALDLSYHFIEAQNGTGIVCNQEVKLYLCQIAADTASIIAPDFTADTCAIFPAVTASGTIINRQISKLNPDREYIALGDPLPDFSCTPIWATATLSADSYDDALESIYITPDVSGIDTSVAGVFSVRITFEDRLLPFGLAPEDESLFHIEICDTSVPWFTGIGSFWGMYYYAAFWYRADDLSGLTLWRSDDEGTSWYDHTADADIEFYDGKLELCFSEITERPIWFVWEVEGIESQILYLSWDGIELTGAGGGDRTGGDRGPNTLPPVTMPIPIPTPNEPDDGAQTAPPASTPPLTEPDDGAQTAPPASTPPLTEPDDGAQTAPPASTPPLTEPDDGAQTAPPASTPPLTEPDDGAQTAPPASTPPLTEPDNGAQTAPPASTPTPIPLLPAQDDGTQTATLASPPTSMPLLSAPDDGVQTSTPAPSPEVEKPASTPAALGDEASSTPTPTTGQTGGSHTTPPAQPVGTPSPEPFLAPSDTSADLTEQSVPAIAITNPATPTVVPTPPQEAQIEVNSEPYTDSVKPIVIVGSVSLACAGTYLGFTRIRQVKRT